MKNLHLLPTEKPSRLVKIYNDVNRENFTLKLDVEVNDSFKEYVNIYITSDEEIKEGDVVKIPCGVGKVKELTWKYGNDNPSYIVEDIFIYKLRYGQKEGELQINSFRYEDVKKIILTTDQDLINDGVQPIPDEFLQWFVENPNCEDVEIYQDKKDYGTFQWYSEYKIIIPKEEPKQETLEEAAEKFYPPKTTDLICSPKLVRDSFIAGAKWQQEQDKNLYSEEDMIEFADFYYQYKELIKLEKWEIIEIPKKDIFKKWFEQFKKQKKL